MTVLVLVILGLIWGFVLIPPYIQSRRENRPGDSIASFRQQLHVLERTTPGAATDLSRLDVGRYQTPRYDPRSNVTRLAARRPAPSPQRLRRAEVRRRRRDVFVTLLGAVAITFVLGVALGGAAWMVHLAVDVVFGVYILLLISLQQQGAEKDLKVRYMPPPPARRQAPPQLALRRYGS